MKPILISTLFVIISFYSSIAQTNDADRIIGLWLTKNKDGKVEIFKSGNLYYGRLVWGNDMYEADGKTSRKDINNPNPKLRNRPIHNFVFLTHFEYKDDIWEGGKIYDARMGKTYDCILKYVNGKIEIRAYLGMPIFGLSEQWTRIK